MAFADRITGSHDTLGTVVLCVRSGSDGAWSLICNWELMRRASPLSDKRRRLMVADARPG